VTTRVGHADWGSAFSNSPLLTQCFFFHSAFLTRARKKTPDREELEKKASGPPKWSKPNPNTAISVRPVQLDGCDK
jgi:hypothetical protein